MIINPISSTITPITDTQGTIQPSKVDHVRAIRMQTNSTTLENQQPLESNVEIQAPVEATQPLSPQLALLAKQRRALQQERREFENLKKASSQRSDKAMIDATLLKSDPLKVMLDHGVTYDQLTEAILNSRDNPEHAFNAKIQALEKSIDERFSKSVAENEKQVLAEMQREASQLVTNGDEFEFVRETNSIPKVMNLIERTYRETGEVLDVQEALKLFEEELFKDAQKLTSLKKMQMQTQQQPQQRPGVRPLSQQRPLVRTLTNRDTASIPMTAKARAMAAFYGNLK
jgi:hypothetical protein